MTYRREIPRDLFNEANLLKCLGQLALIAHDRNRHGFRMTNRPGSFLIEQDEADGSIYCATVHIVIGERLFDHRRPLNSRDPWPLYVRRAFQQGNDPDWLDDDFEAFSEAGDLSDDFRKLVQWHRPEGRR